MKSSEAPFGLDSSSPWRRNDVTFDFENALDASVRSDLEHTLSMPLIWSGCQIAVLGVSEWRLAKSAKNGMIGTESSHPHLSEEKSS